MLTITNEDNMELMARYPDKYFDLAIVDPPYGINIKTRIFNDGKKWDSEIPSKEYFNELFRVSKNQIIWGGNYFTEYLKPTSCYIIWDKKMTDKHLMSMSEFAWTSFDSKNLIFRQPPVGDRGFYNIDGARIHPTQKSIDLYKWQLSFFAKPIKCKCGATGHIGIDSDIICNKCNNTSNIKPLILDTHLGSGSIAIACHDYGFDLTACELDKEYFDKAIERINNHTAQTKLF